uniref:Uncharacterized protein n=1 Tax=Rhizophora mucronata TaxID=61149 RepID=A0A2P2R3P4_RHIMU
MLVSNDGHKQLAGYKKSIMILDKDKKVNWKCKIPSKSSRVPYKVERLAVAFISSHFLGLHTFVIMWLLVQFK